MRNTDKKLRIVSIKLPDSLDKQLTALAGKRGTSRSAVIREALLALDRAENGSFAKAAARYLGSVKGGPTDLSHNPDHLADLGK